MDGRVVNRRGFLRRLGLAVAGYALSRQLGGLLPAPPHLITVDDPNAGISVRFVRQFDGDQQVCRFDVLYGFGVVRRDFPIRVEGA